MTLRFFICNVGKEMAKGRSKKRRATVRYPLESTNSFWVVAGLMLVTAVVYANSLGGEFLFDDLQFVQNPRAQNIETLSDAVDFSGFRRLTFMTYGLNVYFGGMNPLGFHIVNVLIHAINVALIYMLLMHFAGGVRYPAAVGALNLCRPPGLSPKP